MTPPPHLYDPVIGLETHVQVKTSSKIFCGCATPFGAPPNSQVCPVCLGFPGVLPVLNHQVLLFGIRVALGLQCRIQPKIVFHRKNYFYPDLPKAYQISQYDLPLGRDGFVDVGTHKIRIHRVHMEEDAGKLIHKEGEDASLVDYNRAGVPLLEIVTEPDITSSEEAFSYLKILKGVLEYLDVSDCDMEKGSLRCDVNVSLRPHAGTLGTKVEIKNLNSFRAAARSIDHEIARQTDLLERGEAIRQETRLWDDAQGVTQSMRSKEFAHDYRYFPEPDLVPFSVSEAEIDAARAALPELPGRKSRRFSEDYKLPVHDAVVLTSSKKTADYYEQCIRLLPENSATLYKSVSNWIIGEMAREMNERNLDDIAALQFSPEFLVELIRLIDSGHISSKMAKEVFVGCLSHLQSPSSYVKEKGLVQVTDRSALMEAARGVIQENAQAAEDFRNGKAQSLMFLVGQLMRKTKGAASPSGAQDTLRELLAVEQKS